VLLTISLRVHAISEAEEVVKMRIMEAMGQALPKDTWGPPTLRRR
jgi:hypothetical protein